MTKKYYKVSFQYSESVYCANIAVAECAEDVEAYYNKYAWKSVKEATEGEVETAKDKGMPFVTCPHIEPEEPKAEEAQPSAAVEVVRTESAAFAINEAQNGIEIAFVRKPDRATLDALKAAGYRWHNVKKLWYAKNTPERLALACEICHGDTPTQTATTSAKKAEKRAVKAAPQDHIKFYWNGLKVDGKLIKCGYSYRNNADHSDSIMIYARDYESLPRDLFIVQNDTDVYTDYFDNDSTTLYPDHPLYKYALYAWYKCQVHELERSIDFYTKRAEKRAASPSSSSMYKQMAEEARSKLAKLEKVADPGQPTAEDLAKIAQKRMEDINAEKAAEHRAELERREKVLNERAEGRRYIEKVAEAHPITEGAPVVEIPFSENPAFYSWMDSRDQTRTVLTVNPDGSTTSHTVIEKPAEKCILSLAAADEVLAHYDAKVHAEGRGYDKTDFVITWTEPGQDEPTTWNGRYDLGDNEGGLINHLRNFAEWYRTHDAFGHILPEPAETTEELNFVERLAAAI